VSDTRRPPGPHRRDQAANPACRQPDLTRRPAAQANGKSRSSTGREYEADRPRASEQDPARRRGRPIHRGWPESQPRPRSARASACCWRSRRSGGRPGLGPGCGSGGFRARPDQRRGHAPVRDRPLTPARQLAAAPHHVMITDRGRELYRRSRVPPSMAQVASAIRGGGTTQNDRFGTPASLQGAGQQLRLTTAARPLD
jgi:hypothetical protein